MAAARVPGTNPVFPQPPVYRFGQAVNVKLSVSASTLNPVEPKELHLGGNSGGNDFSNSDDDWGAPPAPPPRARGASGALSWTARQMADFIQTVKLPDDAKRSYADAVVSQGVNGAAFDSMVSDSQRIKAIGVTKAIHRAKLVVAWKREKAAAPAASSSGAAAADDDWGGDDDDWGDVDDMQPNRGGGIDGYDATDPMADHTKAGLGFRAAYAHAF